MPCLAALLISSAFACTGALLLAFPACFLQGDARPSSAKRPDTCPGPSLLRQLSLSSARQRPRPAPHRFKGGEVAEHENAPLRRATRASTSRGRFSPRRRLCNLLPTRPRARKEPSAPQLHYHEVRCSALLAAAGKDLDILY